MRRRRRLFFSAALVIALFGWLQDAQAQFGAGSAADIVQNDPQCPESGDCTISLQFFVLTGSTLDFGDRNVTLGDTGALNIGDGVVKLLAGSFTVAGGGLVDGRGQGASPSGGTLEVTTTGDILIEESTSATRGILVGATSQAGFVTLDAGGGVGIYGNLRAEGLGANGSGGVILVKSGADIVTGSSSDITVAAGVLEFGGDLGFDAAGLIDVRNRITATGADGGTIALDAEDRVIVLETLDCSGVEGGGSIDVVAGDDVTISGQLLAKAGAEGVGGLVDVRAVGGDVVVNDVIDVSGIGDEAESGSIDVSTGSPVTAPQRIFGGSVLVHPSGELISEALGFEGIADEIAVAADLDVLVESAARISVAAGETAGQVEIFAGRHVRLSGPIDASAVMEGFTEGGTITVQAGERGGGDVSIDAFLDASAGNCSPGGFCGLGGTVSVTGCDVRIGALGRIDAFAPGADGDGGQTTLEARRLLSVQGPIDSTGQRFEGANQFHHPSATPPSIAAMVVPAPEILACDDACTGCSSFCNDLCDCGTGTIDQYEQCDGEMGCGVDESCAVPGTEIECTCITTCGNGTIEAGEECDGNGELGGATCESLGFAGGDLECNPDCSFNLLVCLEHVCGDDIVADEEVCEASDLDGESCESLGFAGGTLACAVGCLAFDTSACTIGVCGDDLRCFNEACTDGPDGGPEECDDGAANGDDAGCRNDCGRATCGDGLVCSAETCTTGPGAGVEECDDGAANGPNGRCLATCAEASCGDGNVCSDPGCTSGPGGGPEECDGGFCCLSTCESRSCDDLEPCTDDTCEEGEGCVNTPLTGVGCDDGDACTLNDACVAGVCQGVQLDCLSLDSGPCFVSTGCDPVEGCVVSRSAGFGAVDCLVTLDIADLRAAIDGAADELGKKITKRLQRYVKKAEKGIRKASAAGNASKKKAKKASKQLKKAAKQLSKLAKFLDKQAQRGKVAPAFATQLNDQAQALGVSVETLVAELST